jgi:lipooligosaccharide transport system ATP-binding protein
VAENLLVFGRYFGMSDAAIRARIGPLLEFAQLGAKRDARIQELSGGMKKRAGLARAMALDPEILFFDEPTGGLDPVTAAEMESHDFH